jgi:hypothetical protein
MAILRTWWRVFVIGLALVSAIAVAPHWDVIAFGVFVGFSILPVLCWLLVGASWPSGPAVGLVLACLSVVPGLVLGPGGFAMYRVVAGGVWIAVAYLPLTLLIVAITAVALAWRARRRTPRTATPRSARRGAWIASCCAAVAVVLGYCCGGMEGDLEDGEVPTAPTDAIIGMLPASLTVVSGPAFDGGSSVSNESYAIAGSRGQAQDEIAHELGHFIATLTRWPVPDGYSDRCYRASGFISYSGRFCLSIRPADSRADAVALTISAWDNRFGGFSPDPG